MTDDALDRCPFCGGKPEVVRFEDPVEWAIECQRCAATSGFVDDLDTATAASLVRAWNRRALPIAAAVAEHKDLT